MTLNSVIIRIGIFYSLEFILPINVVRYEEENFIQRYV